MRPIISIIVPVYNVEVYLRQCLDSILSQTFTAWELILVDDGSPDGSGAICDEYAAKDSRVRVFHISNGGVSNARNVGMDAAKGDWITFIDSDDWVAPDFIEKLYAPIVNNPCLDFVHGGMQSYCEKDGVSNYRVFKYYVGEDKAYLLKTFDGHTVSKLFKRDILIDNQLKFDCSILISEDHIFNVNYIQHINLYCFSDAIGYFYRLRIDSATHSRNTAKSFLTYLSKNTEFLKEYTNSHQINEIDARIRWIKLSDKVFYTIYYNKFDKVSAKKIAYYINKFRLCHYQIKWRRKLYLYIFKIYTYFR